MTGKYGAPTSLTRMRRAQESMKLLKPRSDGWSVIEVGFFVNPFGQKLPRVLCECDCGFTKAFSLRKFISKSKIECSQCSKE